MSIVYCDKASIAIEKADPVHDSSSGRRAAKVFPRWNIVVTPARKHGTMPEQKTAKKATLGAGCDDLWDIVNDKCCTEKLCDSKTMTKVQGIIDQTIKFDKELEKSEGCEMPSKIKSFTFKDCRDDRQHAKEATIGKNSLEDKSLHRQVYARDIDRAPKK